MKKNNMKRRLALVLSLCMLGSMVPVSAEENLDTLDIFINESWWPVDSFTGIIPEAIKEATGIDLNVTIASDDNQLGLMIASNELPDIVFTQYELDRLSRSEACYSYNELLETYMPDYDVSQSFTDTQIKIAQSFSSDENYYTILSNFNSEDELAEAAVPSGQMAWFYRQDIWEELGCPKMETMDDILDVCAMVKEKYPDMIPIAGNLYYRTQIFSQWLGGTGNQKYQYLDDGSVVFKSDSPAYYDYLKYCNELARNGYIDAENYASTNLEDTIQLAGEGKCFIYLSYLKPSDCGQLNTRMASVGTEGEFVLGAPLGEAGYVCRKGWCGMFVSKDCSNPEAAIRFITYMFSEEGRQLSKYGREGVEWTMGENGIPNWCDEWLETLKDTDAMNKKYNQYFYLGANAIEDVMGDYGNITEEELAVYKLYQEDFHNYVEIDIAAPTTSSDEGIIETKLVDMLEAEEAKVIFSADDEAFEEAYAELQSKAEKIGVKELNAYMTERVAEVKDQFGF